MSALDGILPVSDDGSNLDDSTGEDSQWVRCAKCVLDITDKTIILNMVMGLQINRYKWLRIS